MPLSSDSYDARGQQPGQQNMPGGTGSQDGSVQTDMQNSGSASTARQARVPPGHLPVTGRATGAAHPSGVTGPRQEEARLTASDWTRTLVKYRQPIPSRSIFELTVTLVPFVAIGGPHRRRYCAVLFPKHPEETRPAFIIQLAIGGKRLFCHGDPGSFAAFPHQFGAAADKAMRDHVLVQGDRFHDLLAALRMDAQQRKENASCSCAPAC